MPHRLLRCMRHNWIDALGFACFLGFVYCSLFGCHLAPGNPSVAGMPTSHSLERIWMWSGVAEAAGVLVGLAAAHLLHDRIRTSCWRSGAISLLMGTCGGFAIYCAWCNHSGDAFEPLYTVGGMLCGLAIALYAVTWGRRFSSFDEARIEFVISMAFPLSFVLYLLLLQFKLHALLNLALVIGMCTGSSLRLMYNQKPQGTSGTAPAGHHDTSTLRGIFSFGALVTASWVQIAYFRVISTPALSGDRFSHYLYPFLLACVVALFMLVLCIYVSRYLNITLAYRWSLPLFVLAYVPLLMDYDDRTLRMMGYAINFLGMFGVQFGCWLGASKFACRKRVDPALVFGVFAFGEGLGIALGSFMGLFAMYHLDRSYLSVVSILLLAIVQFVVMFTGFNPNWAFRCTNAPDISKPTAAGDDTQPPTGGAINQPGNNGPTLTMDAVDNLCRQAALDLQETYSLSDREVEVAALLLAGRSRPYIRDELLISLNTVGVHVRKIYVKCGVHSQQELMDLAHSGGVE